MIRSKYSTTGLCLILILIIGLIPRPARADGDSHDQSMHIRIRATATVGPIGTVETMGRMSVNGQVAHGKQLLWGGELIQAPTDMNAHVLVNLVGQVTLSSGGIARIAAATAEVDENTNRRVLVASLISGAMDVKLQQEAGAYIETCGSVLTASNGSSFRIGIREGQPVINGVVGAVQVEPQSAERKYLVRPVGLGSNISVRARSTRQIQIQVTDENDKPVPDLPILFTLGEVGENAGSLGSGATAGTSFTATTNAQGIATAPFNAGVSPGSNTITATVSGTKYSWTGEITITKAVGFWTMQNKILVIAAAAAAGTGTGIAIAKSRNGSKEQVQPLVPIIKPNTNP